MWRLLLVVLVAAGAACGGAARDAAVEEPPCAPGTGRPVSEAALRQAFRAEGVELVRDDRRWCTDELSRLAARGGDVLCRVVRRSSGGRLERFIWRDDPEPVYVRVLNVSCSVHSGRPDADAVERALRRLPGVSTLPARLPSGDARRD
ncbi:MAG TPA: hypothetical protein VM204_07560 [Gaiellaceae bacterium]|nr:hypothetical protein [Gaiellaceae bacterium]